MSVLTAFFAAWRRAPPRGVPPAEERAGIRLLAAPVRAPETLVERLLVETLAAKGPLSRPALVSLAALALYQQELAHGGWVADLGFFGEGLFVREVTRALEGARGVLWEIENPGYCRG
jgi:hypothetical protein